MKRVSSIFRFFGRIEGLPVALILALLYGAFILTAPQVFTHYRIYTSFLQTIPPVLVLALGLTLVVTAGEIDLSFTSVVALSGVVFACFQERIPRPRRGSACAGCRRVGWLCECKQPCVRCFDSHSCLGFSGMGRSLANGPS
jgi:ribose/xylose/arabinose/galactoside ABC-type transport system permease subunit